MDPSRRCSPRNPPILDALLYLADLSAIAQILADLGTNREPIGEITSDLSYLSKSPVRSRQLSAPETATLAWPASPVMSGMLSRCNGHAVLECAFAWNQVLG